MSTIRRFASLNDWLAAVRSPDEAERTRALTHLQTRLAGDISQRPPPRVSLAGEPASRDVEPAPAPRPSAWRQPGKWS